MSEREWFTGGASRVIRDAMVVQIGLNVLAMVVRLMATRSYKDSLGAIVLWLLVYAVAYLFRRRGASS